MFWRLLNIIEILFAVVGLAQVVQTVFFAHKNLLKQNAGILLLPIKRYDQDVEFILKNAIKTKAKKIVCIDLEMTDDAKKICKIITDKNQNISLITRDQVPILLNSL